MRIGIGYDAHPLEPGRKLVLGGVHIPFDEGLEGWSDGDTLTHAVIDALLGAAALGDIGTHFPPGDPEFKEVSSLYLLDKVVEKLEENGWRAVNIDATVVAERPRLREYIDDMRRNFSQVLGITFEQVSVKASTNNGMGAIGRGEGIAAYAVALIEEAKPETE
ncbi:MAG: 2-C-methyl-D-erythritol 2,4-cyclodiphosphate synthase [Dehalococcoidales bacterium]|nr:2-C-methyl-D-erythritol 2,4-cyclodiphosphate synthase [Dehalococcoidales bacterium]